MTSQCSLTPPADYVAREYANEKEQPEIVWEELIAYGEGYQPEDGFKVGDHSHGR